MIYDFLSPVISVICGRSFQMLLLLTIFLHNWCAVRNHKERVGFVGRFLSCQWPKTGQKTKQNHLDIEGAAASRILFPETVCSHLGDYN
jgi:hypothetical protein